MSSSVAIIDVGRTKFGEHYETNPEKLVEEAFLNASIKPEISRKDLDACKFSTYFLPQTNKIGAPEGFVSQLMEINIPMEASYKPFSSAFSAAYDSIKSGRYNLVLVGGMEKMTDRWYKIRDDLMLLGCPLSYYTGATPLTNHELMLREYIKKYDIHDKELEEFNNALAWMSVVNHKNALKNENAQFREEIFEKEISVDDVLRARGRKPLGRYDFAPVSDGASALLLASEEVAKKYTDKPVYVSGIGSATDFISYQSRNERTGFLSNRLAMEKALKKSGLEREEIKLLEIHDESTMQGMVSLEDLGFAEKGKAWLDINKSCEDYQGFYKINGNKLFVNRKGGLKADGNPLGATGGAQIYEIVKQLRAEAGERQINEKLEHGLVLENEGFGVKSNIIILSVVK